MHSVNPSPGPNKASSLQFVSVNLAAISCRPLRGNYFQSRIFRRGWVVGVGSVGGARGRMGWGGGVVMALKAC